MKKKKTNEDLRTQWRRKEKKKKKLVKTEPSAKERKKKNPMKKTEPVRKKKKKKGRSKVAAEWIPHVYLITKMSLSYELWKLKTAKRSVAEPLDDQGPPKIFEKID